MSKKLLAWVTDSPIESIVLTKAAAIVFYAAYYMLPSSLESPGIVNVVFTTPQSHILVGIGLMLPGLWTLYGFFKKSATKLHSGTFGIMFSWLFLAMLRIFTYGPLSFNGWLLFFLPALTSAICYLYLGKKLKLN